MSCLSIFSPYFLLCPLALGLAAFKGSLYLFFPHPSKRCFKEDFFPLRTWQLCGHQGLDIFCLSALQSLACGSLSQGHFEVAEKVLAAPSLMSYPRQEDKGRSKGKGPMPPWSPYRFSIFPMAQPSDFWFYLIGYLNLLCRPRCVNCHF